MKMLQLFLVLLFLSTTALANEPSDLLTVSDVFNLETVSSPQISPDGTKIVYVRQFADIMTDKYYSNLWIINFNGSNNRPLTTGNYSDSSPRWSPDGSRLIFTSNREGSPQIYTRWMDSGQVAKLSNLQHAPTGISWSPDGKQIAFTSFVPGKSPNLIKMPAAPKGAKWAEPAREIDKLVYRFNRQGYLQNGYSHVFVMSAEGGTARQITSGDFHHAGPAFRTG
ncbi:PD40 domain-containing protein, partial [candidate division KSB1 bacterium]|nr:PD40 domain-containing protein [candidate division KSB1 bacterium]